MANSLLAAVSGMRAHQKMIDVAGNNLANLNTTGFKSSRVSFAETLSETLATAGEASDMLGGTNPKQIGSGVQLGSIDRNMGQGGLVTTGEPLDMMIEGEGFFVLNDGVSDVYTRVGAFGVDGENYLVDPNTGYRVQRLGSLGVEDGFQDISNNNIRIPYDTFLPANATQQISYAGNLSADENNVTTNVLSSGMKYTVNDVAASGETFLSDLDQFNGFSGSFEISGFDSDGTAVGPVTFAITSGVTTLDDFEDAISAEFTGATASFVNGELKLVDDVAGYSQTDINIEPAAGATGTCELPNYFKLLSAGGLASKSTNFETFDSQGISHILSVTFVKSETNSWDMVVTSCSGDVKLYDRRIRGISFNMDSSFAGLDKTISDDQNIKLGYAFNSFATHTIETSLGSIGDFDGLSQFGGTTTVAPSIQDGYASGSLSTLSITSDGIVSGSFTNGVRKDIAVMKIAIFQNAAGLSNVGNNYYQASANSGLPRETSALANGAGALRGGSLEGSNVDTATEFINLIKAQNGYQANARTIKVSNEILQELTNLIR